MNWITKVGHVTRFICPLLNHPSDGKVIFAQNKKLK